MRKISKDGGIFGGKMGEREWAAGRALMDRAGRPGDGRFAGTSVDSEDLAPKTWILWKATNKGEEICTIECEIQMTQGSDGRAECMLVGQCPVCWTEHGQQNFFHVQEGNKAMSLDWVKYGKLPPSNHLAINWAWHCKNKLGRAPASDDKIAIVSSPERWICDYCHSWCVKVTDSIAMTDMSGATMMTIDMKATSR
jgi:hypothetical protein